MNYHADSHRGFCNASFLSSQNNIYNREMNTYICQYHNNVPCYNYGRAFPDIVNKHNSTFIPVDDNFQAIVIDYILLIPHVYDTFHQDNTYVVCRIFKDFLKSITYGVSIIHNKKVLDDMICQNLYKQLTHIHKEFLNKELKKNFF